MCKIRCIVVDDEPLAVEMLAGYVLKTPSLELAGTYTDPVKALSAIAQHKPELVFLDIQMPDLNGLELSRLLPPESRVVFTTAFKQYAFESYEVEALDYLLKPVRYQKFLEAVAKAEKSFSIRQIDEEHKEDKSFFIKSEGEYRKIAFNDILYISGMKDYVVLHLDSGKGSVITHMTMKAMEEMLPSDRFMRVHRSHIVALSKITSVDSYGDLFLGEVAIPVSETYRKEVDKYIQAHLLSR